MAFKVITHTPAINEEGVDRNGSIEITFSNTIIASSVEPYKLSINDSSDFTTVPGDYSVSGNKVIFTPTINMLPNNKYTVFVHGKPNSILSITNEQLLETYSFEFTTGTTLATSTPSGLSTPVLLSGSYNYDDNELNLIFNTCIETANISGNVCLSVYNGLQSACLDTSTFTAECRNVTIPVSTGNAAAIESMMDIDSRLEISFPTGVFFYQTNYNIASDYFPISYVGNVSGVPSGIPSGIYPMGLFSGFYVYKTSPQHQQPNVASGLASINITFTGSVVGPASSLSGYITVTEKDVLE